MQKNGSQLEQIIGQLGADITPCEACGYYAILSKQVLRAVPQSILSADKVQGIAAPVEGFRLCLWCGKREHLKVQNGRWKVVEVQAGAISTTLKEDSD